MAIRVGTGQTTQVKTIRGVGQTTQVKKVVVGRPVRNVASSTVSIHTLLGVNTGARVNGSVLVFNSSTANFEATLDLDKQNINGGTF
jgi:hypothetical protein|tara:strand:+ start:835 stop:1095 length:261 start_codon:yes stop_codon:yes gene_type:complete